MCLCVDIITASNGSANCRQTEGEWADFKSRATPKPVRPLAYRPISASACWLSCMNGAVVCVVGTWISDFSLLPYILERLLTHLCSAFFLPPKPRPNCKLGTHRSCARPPVYVEDPHLGPKVCGVACLTLSSWTVRAANRFSKYRVFLLDLLPPPPRARSIADYAPHLDRHTCLLRELYEQRYCSTLKLCCLGPLCTAQLQSTAGDPARSDCIVYDLRTGHPPWFMCSFYRLQAN